MGPRKLSALVVDDEPSLVRVVEGYLAKEGFDVRTAGDGETALALARESEPDLVVLDLGLPGIDGIEVCRELRTFSRCYILMLTARADEVDVLIGLGVGADDYVTKPFSPRQLMARVAVLLRRPRTGTIAAPDERPQRVFGDLVIDPGAREVRVGAEVVPLTRLEYDLLDALSSRPRVVLSRRQLLEAVWDEGPAVDSDEHLVDIHVGHLRRKLGDDPRSARYVQTVRGVGYRMGPG
ncbi:MAG TPA: response regulator transcription factor [Propionibacteriaceae bacterium]|nr:response regulator transcription factor [Propionibacteriaceae bacterium]